MSTTLEVPIECGAPIPTWFGVGGRADRLAHPSTLEELQVLLAAAPDLRVLGDGANLLVDDAGVGELVVRLDRGEFQRVDVSADGRVRVGAGVHLFKLINRTVHAGLAGLEVLAGIPASVGGALAMNAGGAFGQIADVVERVHALDPASGRAVTLDKREVGFAYRSGGVLRGLVVTSAELSLDPTDPARVTARRDQCNAYKLRTQPMNAHSAGCCFKNPTLRAELPGVGKAGERVSAGLLIDLAGLKGTRIGGAEINQRHGNFIVVDKEHATASDVLRLMDAVTARVLDFFAVRLEPEVVVWRRTP